MYVVLNDKCGSKIATVPSYSVPSKGEKLLMLDEEGYEKSYLVTKVERVLSQGYDSFYEEIYVMVEEEISNVN